MGPPEISRATLTGGRDGDADDPSAVALLDVHQTVVSKI